jgi:hypothetical protein
MVSNEAAPVSSQQVTADNIENKPSTKIITYVVVRDGSRVSDREYSTSTDPAALVEKEFWSRVEKNHSWGAPVEIVQYDSKKHRTW